MKYGKDVIIRELIECGRYIIFEAKGIKVRKPKK